MDSEKQGETEEATEASKEAEDNHEDDGVGTEDATKEPKGDVQSEDEEKPSQEATSAEDAEGRETKSDQDDANKGGDKEAEVQNKHESDASDKGEASAEAKGVDTAAEEGSDKEGEEKDKKKAVSSEIGEEETKSDADKGIEQKDDVPEKQKSGKSKSAKEGKHKKTPKDTETSTKKAGKAPKSPRKGGKKHKVQSKDAEKPSQDATSAEDAEGKETKSDQDGTKKGGDKEAEIQNKHESDTSDKGEASTEAKDEETVEEEEEEEDSNKEPEEKDKKEPDSSEIGEEEIKADADKGVEKKDDAPEKHKSGKSKLAKEGKHKKPPADTETSSKKAGKAPKSPRKGGKKKRKKGAQAAKEEPPTAKQAPPVSSKEEEQPSEEKKVDDVTTEKSTPAKSGQEEQPSRGKSRVSVKSEAKVPRDSSAPSRELARKTSSRPSSSNKHISRKDLRSRASKQTRVKEPGEEEEEEKMEMEPKEKGPFDIEGVVHLVISPELQEKLECTIGEEVTAESPWTNVDKKTILKDITHNKHSDFRSVHENIKEYKDHQVLVGYNVASDIPNMFYVCITEPAKTKIEEMLKQTEIERKERVQKMMERYAGEWLSLGSESEIDSWKIVLARPLLEVDVQVSTNKEKKPNIEDCDATVENGRYFKFDPPRVQPTNIERLRVDEGVQACPEKTLAYAQTYLPFPTNSWTQYLYEISEADIALSPELTQKLKEFLEHSYSMVKPVISYNSHFDLYIDDYVGLVQSHRDLAKSKEILYRSYNIFFDVVRCKNKLITACDWHPMWSGIVAVAYAEKLRSLCFGTEPQEAEPILTAYGSSPALIWSFVDEISPRLILECPHQIHALRFCPHDENLLIGGCDNGQVVLWDLTDSLWNVEYEEILTDDQKSYRINLNKHMTWMKRTTFKNIIRTSVTSYLEFSPHACITDVRWLSPYGELNRLGRYHANIGEQKSLQFITSSEDGNLYVWDLQAEVKGGPVKAHKKKRSVPEDLKTGVSKYRNLNLIFSPIFKIHVKDGMEAGTLRLTFMETDSFPLTYSLQKALLPNKVYTLSDRLLYTVSFQQPEELPRSQLFVGTIEGHALHISWAGYETETGEAISSENCKYISYNGSMHDSPVTSVSISPFSPDLVLTVSSRIFAIWREDFKDEPLLWRKSATRMSCGRWSLYRPSSFLICNYDGSITTWDLLLRSNNHVKEQTISGRLITAAYPSKKEPYQHVMAFADFMGSFRVFTVPTAFMEYDEDEEAGLKHFFSREIEACNVFRGWEKRWWEKNSYILEEEQAAREEEEQRLKQEAEKRAKEEAKRALEDEGKKHKKKEKKESWTARYQKKWDELQEINMMKVIMSLKHFRQSELLSKLQPLEVLHEEEEKKNLKHKERIDQAQKLFEDLIYLLFPGTLDAPQSVHRSAEVLFSHIEEIPVKLLDVYQDLEKESLAYVQEHQFTYDFSWRTMLNEGLQRRRTLDEQLCPRAGRNTRYMEERRRLSALAQSQMEQEEEEDEEEMDRKISHALTGEEEEEEEEDEGESGEIVVAPSRKKEEKEEEEQEEEDEQEAIELKTKAKEGSEEDTDSAAPPPEGKP